MKDNPATTPACRRARRARASEPPVRVLHVGGEPLPVEGDDDMTCAWVWLRGTLACLRDEVEVERQVAHAPPLAVLLSYRHAVHKQRQLTGEL